MRGSSRSSSSSSSSSSRSSSSNSSSCNGQGLLSSWVNGAVELYRYVLLAAVVVAAAAAYCWYCSVLLRVVVLCNMLCGIILWPAYSSSTSERIVVGESFMQFLLHLWFDCH